MIDRTSSRSARISSPPIGVSGADERLSHPRRNDDVPPRLRSGEHRIAHHSPTQRTGEDVHPLRTVDAHARITTQGPKNQIDPWPGRIDHDLRTHLERFPRQQIGRANPFDDQTATLLVDDEPVGTAVIDENRPGRLRGLHVGQQQPLGMHVQCVVIGERPEETRGFQPRHRLKQLLLRHPTRVRNTQRRGSFAIAIERQQVVQRHAGAEKRRAGLAPPPRGHDELRLLDEVRCTERENAPLAQALSHDRKVVLLEVTDTPVDVFGRGGARFGSEIATVDQGHLQAPRSGLSGHPDARDTPADDDNVEALAQSLHGSGKHFRPLPGRRRATCPKFTAPLVARTGQQPNDDAHLVSTG